MTVKIAGLVVFTVTVEIVLGFAVRVGYIIHRLTVTINLIKIKIIKRLTMKVEIIQRFIEISEIELRLTVTVEIVVKIYCYS